MLLVIFGAGASYDAIPEHARSSDERRLPLAKDLFAPRALFAESLSRFPQCHESIPRLRKAGVSVEQELDIMHHQAVTYENMRVQLAAVRYYLQAMISGCADAWRSMGAGITSYRSLLGDFERLAAC